MAAGNSPSDDPKGPESTPRSQPRGKGKEVATAVPKVTQAQDDETRSSSSEDEGEDEVEPMESEDEGRMLVDSASTTKRSSCTYFWLKDVVFTFYSQRSSCPDKTRRCGYQRGLEGWRTVSCASLFSFTPSYVVKCSLCSSYQNFFLNRSDNKTTRENRYSHFISAIGHAKKCQN